MPALKVKAAGVWNTIVGPQGVTGPTGPQGPAGPSGFPVGMPAPWLLETNPTGWLLADGGTFDGTVYPALAALYGTTFGAISGNLYRLPNLQGKFLVGQDTGDIANPDPLHLLRVAGGSKRHSLTSAESGLPAHNHAAGTPGNPGSGRVLAETQEHQHYVSVGGGGHEHNYAVRGSAVAQGTGNVVAGHFTLSGSLGTSGGGGHTHEAWSGGRSAVHDHEVAIANNAAANASTSHQNLPPYYVCRWIIRAAP